MMIKSIETIVIKLIWACLNGQGGEIIKTKDILCSSAIKKS